MLSAAAVYLYHTVSFRRCRSPWYNVQHVLLAYDVHTPQKAQEESDASAWGAEATLEEDREERLVMELTDILGQNKASRTTKKREYDLPPTIGRYGIALKGRLLSDRTLSILIL